MRRQHRLVMRPVIFSAVLGSLLACEQTPTDGSPPRPEQVAAIHSSGTYHDFDADLYLISLGAAGSTRLTQGMEVKDPARSPDGRRIAFLNLAHSGTGLYVINADGTNLQRIADGAYTPAWSPDGQWIAAGGLTTGSSGIHVMRLGDTKWRRLQACNCATPSWSPDGRRIVFYELTAEGRTLYTMDADGSNRTVLPTGLADSMHPAWSTDGEWIAFAGRPDPRLLSYDIYLIRPDGTGLRRVTESPGYADWEPTFSPDGSRLVFGSYSYAVGVSHLHVVGVDGKGRTQITTPPGSYAAPSWR